ncbi:MAG: hypothetical protein WCF84_24335, partial [Anaerolineae bacterium]
MTSRRESLDHILTLLGRLDLLIRREVLGLRARSPEKAIDDFKGLYISEEEVDAFLHDSLAAAT